MPSGNGRTHRGIEIPPRIPVAGEIVAVGKQDGKEDAVLPGEKSTNPGHLKKFPRLPAFFLTGPAGHHILYALWSSTTRYTTGNVV